MSAIPQASTTEAEELHQFPYWRSNLRVLPFAGVLSALGFALCWPFLPLMLSTIGVREHLETWVGYMMLVFYIVSCVSGPLWGGIADYYGRKIMMLRATLGMGVLMSLLPFTSTPLAFACLFAVVGLCNGAIASAQALLVANTPPARIGTGLSLLQTGTLMGHALGPALGTLIAAWIFQPHWMFWVSGASLMASGLLVLFLVHEVKQLAGGPWRPRWIGDLRALLRVPRIGALYYLCFLFAGLWTGNVTTISIYVLQLPGAGDAASGAFWIGAAAMGLSLSSALALPVWGRLLDRYDPARILIFATAAAAITQLPLLLLETPLQLVIARIAFGVTSCAMLPSIIRLLLTYAPHGMDARAISYAASCQFIAMGLAPFCAGLIGPVLGLRAYFALAAVLTFAGLALWLRKQRLQEA